MNKLIDLDQVEFLKVDGNVEFNHGVDCCINKLLKQERVKAIPMNKVKKVIDEIKDLERYFDNDYYSNNKDSMFKCDEVLAILNKLIEIEE